MTIEIKKHSISKSLGNFLGECNFVSVYRMSLIKWTTFSCFTQWSDIPLFRKYGRLTCFKTHQYPCHSVLLLENCFFTAQHNTFF